MRSSGHLQEKLKICNINCAPSVENNLAQYFPSNQMQINRMSFSADVGLGLSILPLAALLTGTMLTIGIAVLLVVVVAIRKRRETTARNICGDKDKHLGECGYQFQAEASLNLNPSVGMDMKVMTPLDMGARQQRYVVAYTLKQGVEKQPDILNAQKSNEIIRHFLFQAKLMIEWFPSFSVSFQTRTVRKQSKQPTRGNCPQRLVPML